MAKEHIPLYVQIKEYIIDKINSGFFKPGDKIYSEAELKEKFKVSSTTVVKALNELVNESYLERIQGKGSFVSTPKFKRTPMNLSITEELKIKGIELKTEVLTIEEVVRPEISHKLNIPEDSLLCKVERLRYIEKNGNKEPIAIQTSYIPTNVVSINDLELLYEVDSLYKVLYQTRSLKPHRAKEIYSIKIINQNRLAKLLNQKKSDPVFFVKRVTYTNDDIPFEYAESFLRWDRYTLEVELFETNRKIKEKDVI